jgi:AcrR family transcriptional regulator
MKSTTLEKTAPRTRDATQTRERILAAARARFSHHSYENVGTRDIAGDAGVDAALVNRYFGSKEGLFSAAIEGVFELTDHLPTQMSELGNHLVAHVLDDPGEPDAFDALNILLHAMGSPTSAPLVSSRFHAEFVKPLADRLSGGNAETRATLIASYVIGLATMRHRLGSPRLAGAGRRLAADMAAAAIQACVD